MMSPCYIIFRRDITWCKVYWCLIYIQYIPTLASVGADGLKLMGADGLLLLRYLKLLLAEYVVSPLCLSL